MDFTEASGMAVEICMIHAVYNSSNGRDTIISTDTIFFVVDLKVLGVTAYWYTGSAFTRCLQSYHICRTRSRHVYQFVRILTCNSSTNLFVLSKICA